MFTRIFGAAALLLALVIITYAPQAQALSCIQPEPVATFVQNGGVVFIGSTAKNTSVGTAFENDQSVDKRKVLFNVEHAWSTNQITSPFTLFDYVPPIANDKDIWGFSKTFEVGKKYVIYARYENGEYRADIGGCARSHEFQGGNVQAGISESLGAGYTPTGEAVTPTTDGGDDSFVNGLLAQIQSLLALVADLQERLRTTAGGSDQSANDGVTDFESCVAKTGLVMESYPRQCAYNGRTYREVIVNEPGIPSRICPILARNLYRGIEGSDVSILQQFLQQEGFYTYPSITGYFGGVTEQAVQAWQARNGVVSGGTPDATGYGVVGPATRSAIQRFCGRALPTPTEPTFCTAQYDPVCGQVGDQVKTYGNACELKNANARHLYDGECRADTQDRTAPNNCKVWNDGCNTCSRTEPGGIMACTLRACIWQGIPKCEMYFDGTTDNEPTAPVVHSFTGPTVLDVKQAGVWTIKASDPQNGTLSYKVDWGDNRVGSAFDAISALANSGFVQQTTFQHTYSFAGTYTVSIIVRDEQGYQTKTTTTVKVGGGEADEGFSVTSASGTAPLTSVATITLAPRPAIDLIEVCGPIVVGTINWGDGTTSNPTRLGCSSQRVVTATHTYTTAGTYTVTFARTDGIKYTQNITVKPAGEITACTLEYAPVCGAKSACPTCGTLTQIKTYSNKCFLESDNATFLYGGACTTSSNSGGQTQTCVGGSAYGGGFYEECNEQDTTSLSVYEPSGGIFNRGDDIRIRWSSNVDNADSAMYLVLEDEKTGKRFKSMKVNRALGQATMKINSCNFFFSDGIEGNCASLYDNVVEGGLRYRIRAVVYSPADACFGFCPAGSTTNAKTIIEGYSSPFTIGS